LDKQAAVKKLQLQISTIQQSANATTSKLQASIDSLGATLAAKETQVSDLANDLHECEISLEGAKRAAESGVSEKESHDEETRRQLESLSEVKDDLRASLDGVERALTVAESERDALVDEKAALETERAKNGGERDKLVGEKGALESSLAASVDEKSALEAELAASADSKSALDSSRSSLATSAAELKIAQSSLAAVEVEKDALLSSVERLQAANEGLVDAAETRDRKNSDLEAAVDKLKGELDAVKESNAGITRLVEAEKKTYGEKLEKLKEQMVEEAKEQMTQLLNNKRKDNN